MKETVKLLLSHLLSWFHEASFRTDVRYELFLHGSSSYLILWLLLRRPACASLARLCSFL